MKHKKIVLLVSIVLLILILVLCSSDIQLYKSSLRNSTNSIWNNVKTSSTIGNTKKLLPNISYSIVVKFNETLVGDIYSAKPIYIDISNNDFGTLWFPLYKKSEFQISTIIQDSQTFKTDSTTCNIQIEGKINVSGEYMIIGLCSYKKAKSLVIEKIMNDIYKEAKEKINQTTGNTR